MTTQYHDPMPADPLLTILREAEAHVVACENLNYHPPTILIARRAVWVARMAIAARGECDDSFEAASTAVDEIDAILGDVS